MSSPEPEQLSCPPCLQQICSWVNGILNFYQPDCHLILHFISIHRTPIDVNILLVVFSFPLLMFDFLLLSACMYTEADHSV